METQEEIKKLEGRISELEGELNKMTASKKFKVHLPKDILSENLQMYPFFPYCFFDDYSKGTGGTNATIQFAVNIGQGWKVNPTSITSFATVHTGSFPNIPLLTYKIMVESSGDEASIYNGQIQITNDTLSELLFGTLNSFDIAIEIWSPSEKCGRTVIHHAQGYNI